jgi:hypothetical protein
MTTLTARVATLAVDTVRPEAEAGDLGQVIFACVSADVLPAYRAAGVPD